jgi:hypothetical protein
LSGDEFLASTGKIRSRWILTDSEDLFFQRRILTGKQDKQEAGKNERWEERRVVSDVHLFVPEQIYFFDRLNNPF